MYLTYVCFGVLFLGAGLLFAAGKLHLHLTAWKQMTPEEKRDIRIRPLCRNIGGMIALCGLLFLLAGLWPAFRVHGFVWAMLLWMAAAAVDFYRIGKSPHYSIH